MAIIKYNTKQNETKNNCWGGEIGTFVHCWWENDAAAMKNSMGIPQNS